MRVFPMLNSCFDHVAFATKNSDASMKIFSILGFDTALYRRQKIDRFNVLISKLSAPGGQVVELVEPIGLGSVVDRVLQDKDASIYHGAFYTNNILQTLQQLIDAGAVIVTEPMSIPYPATEQHKNYKTSHVFHPSVGLFEVTGPGA